MRRALFNLHLYAGLAAAFFILILSLTGSIIAFETEIDHILHWHLSYVRPQGRALSLAEITAIVQKRFPGQRIFGYTVATSPDLSYSVSLPRRELYVNPYTGELLGTRPNGVSLLGRIHQLHVSMLLVFNPSLGRDILSWSSVAMLFLLLSGIYLWWPYQRFGIQWKGSARRVWFDIHAVVGIFSLVFLLVLTVSGILLGFEAKTVPLFYKMTGSTPSRPPHVDAAPPAAGKRIDPDRALEIARAALPGTTPFAIPIPGPRGAYEIQARYPEDLTPGGRSWVIVDQYTGVVLYAEGSRQSPAGARMVNATRALHTGDMFGMPGKTVMSVASLMAVVEVVSGVIMWWNKRKRAA